MSLSRTTTTNSLPASIHSQTLSLYSHFMIYILRISRTGLFDDKKSTISLDNEHTFFLQYMYSVLLYPL